MIVEMKVVLSKSKEANDPTLYYATKASDSEMQQQ